MKGVGSRRRYTLGNGMEDKENWKQSALVEYDKRGNVKRQSWRWIKGPFRGNTEGFKQVNKQLVANFRNTILVTMWLMNRVGKPIRIPSQQPR